MFSLKKIYSILLLAGMLTSDSFSADSEPVRVLYQYFSFFNPGPDVGLNEFHACLVPEERVRENYPPSLEQRSRSPIGEITVLDELCSGQVCEIRYRLEKTRLIRSLVLENRNGKWLVNTRLSISKNLNSTPADHPDRSADEIPQVPHGWQSAPSPEWEVFYDRAAAKAKKMNRKLFAISLSSPKDKQIGKDLNRYIFPEFKKYAAENLVLICLNYNQGKTARPKEQQDHDSEVCRRLQLQSGAVVQDVNTGRVIARMRRPFIGRMNYQNYMLGLDSVVNSGRKGKYSPPARQDRSETADKTAQPTDKPA